MRKRMTTASVLVASVAMLLTACGAEESGGQADRAASTTPTTAATTTTAPAAEVAALPSAACGTADLALAPGEEKIMIATAEGERWYFRHLPEGYDGERPVPLVVDFHGYSEGATIHALHSALGPYGSEQGFVTVTPHGTGEVPLWRVVIGSPDLELFGALLDHIEASVCIDRARVYVTGLSNGAMMTSAVACQYADRVAAAAPVAGVAQLDDCEPTRAVPVVAFHGTDDQFLPYEGGLGSAVDDLPTPDGSGRLGDAPEAAEERRRGRATGRTVPDVMAAWGVRNGCDTDEAATERIGDDVVRLSFACPAGAEVEWYRVDGGGHSWPGSEFSQNIEDIVGATTYTISANEVMWEFFREHPLR